jgi:hypothetical protein
VGSTSGQCRLSQILKFYVAAREKKFTWFSVIFYKLVYADVVQNQREHRADYRGSDLIVVTGPLFQHVRNSKLDKIN